MILLLLLPLQVFHVGNQEYPALEHSKYIWVSKNCEKKCQASVAIEKKYENPPTLERGSGGMNPGAWICKNAAKGKVFIALDDEKNQISFCLFDDGSYVNNGAFQIK